MSRARAERIPAVTVPPKPNGLPIASTQSPTRSWSELPHLTAVSGFVDSTLSSARSTFGSLPTTFAVSCVLSWRMTVISSASAMTWLLVTT